MHRCLRTTLGVASLLALISAPMQAQRAPVHLIGWWDNPTPANVWFSTAGKTYTVAEQGGVQAEGDWPEFTDRQLRKTNGPHGYGCVEIEATVRGDRVLRIVHATALPLSSCRSSAALRRAEPRNR